jgi:ABC transporter with metal-binding/Fe-S-binding domain ATP-binding protein
MKLAILYSGGKDSNYALYLAQKHGHEVSCLVSMKSKNKESYMFQTPGNEFVSVQAECLDIPLLHFDTKGIKEDEIEDMKSALLEAKKKYGIEGVVTGAIKSAYQAQRVQRVCFELGLECFNPLWQIDEKEFMESLIDEGFDVRIIGVFSYPLSSEWVGKKVTVDVLRELKDFNKKYGLSIAGEGGELETFVVDGPNFKKKIEIKGTPTMDSENAGILEIISCEVVEK